MKKAFGLILCLILVVAAQGQQTHQVQSGDTWYGISKTYRTSVDTLLKMNPEAVGGLQPGMMLRIPSIESASPPKQAASTGFISHLVKEGETLYGLSRHYEVSIDSMLAWNPSIRQGLKAGQSLLIRSPKHQNNEKQVARAVLPKEVQKDTTGRAQLALPKDVPCEIINQRTRALRICLMLPFGGGAEPGASLAASFYHGFKVGLDSLSPVAGDVQLSIFDTQSPSWESRLNTGNWIINKDTPDVVVGPLFTDKFLSAAQALRETGRPLISPFSQSQDIAKAPGSTVQLTPTENSHWRELFGYFKTWYPNARIVLVQNPNKGDSISHDKIKRMLFETLGSDSTRVRQPGFRPASVYAELQSDQKSIVILTRSGELDVKNFLTGFNRLLKEKDELLLVGRQAWINFQILEVGYYGRMNLHLPAPYQHAWQDSLTKAFRNRYRLEYELEPDYFAVQGFELAKMLMHQWNSYGRLNFHCPLKEMEPAAFELTEFEPGKYRNILHRFMVFDQISYRIQSLYSEK